LWKTFDLFPQYETKINVFSNNQSFAFANEALFLPLIFFMKFLFAFLCTFGIVGIVQSQSVSELENRLNRATTSRSDKMNLCYQIAEKYLAAGSYQKAADYAHRSNMLASELGEKRRESEAIALTGDAYLRARNYSEAAARYNRAWNTARNYGQRDMAINAMKKLEDIAIRQNNLNEALKWSRELVNYLSDNTGRSGTTGDVSARLQSEIQQLRARNQELSNQLAQASGQTQALESNYRQTEAQLREEQTKAQEELNRQKQAISSITTEKQSVENVARERSQMIENLTKEQLADSVQIAQQALELETQKGQLVKAELSSARSAALRNIMALLAGFVLILAGLFYMRYRAKRRTAEELSAKNALIAEEQQKSDALLLNILPPAIAQELKTRNKVAARQYDQATVMFIDFIGFTQVAERLSPEALVQELDYCFSNFDEIISKYRIEKIKTVGDAYICASGLSDMNASPTDMIKAALQIQDFLLRLKAERQAAAQPCFDARMGIHTGQVVAGVVGARKFAYDIWGDTVNIAARMEQSCEPGRVNVSEVTYWLAKYDFEWQQRGKIAAKNKGMMDMFYVTGIRV
jgi:adenylate cyclase